MSHHSFKSPQDQQDRPGRLTLALMTAVAGLALGLGAAAQAQSEVPPATQTPPEPKKPSVKVSDHMTVELQVKDEDLNNVLELLAIHSQRNIVASKSVGGKVTATLYGVTFYEALDSILHVNGYGYIEQGNFIYVYTLEELKQIEVRLKKRAAKAIRLNYLNAKDAEEFVKPLLSKDGGEIKTSKAAAPFSVPADTPVGGEDYALGATLVVIDYEENINAIEALLKELDTRPAQVLVEATILQTSLNEQNSFGVDFSIIGDVKFSDFINTGGPLSAANALNRGGTGGSAGGLSPADNQGTAVVGSPGNTNGPSTFKVGVVAGDLSIFVKMLDTVTDTVILSNPKILALNRQPSRVLVGRRVGYLSTTSTDTSTTQTVEFLDTGTQLYFRPFVSSEGEIRMELKPQVSEAIIREATDATGAAVSIPDEVTQGLTTNVLVRDGQTIVLGGLFRESTQYGRRQVPFLGDIPIIGAAFRGHDDETQRSEILFLITPTIITDSAIKSQADRAIADGERLRAGSRQGLLPWSREKMTSALNVEAERAARDGDYEKAMFNVTRSLSLNPVQPDALRLREQITGEREAWPDRSLLNHIMDQKAAEKAAEINPSPTPVKWRTPDMSHDLPRTKIGPGERSDGVSPRPSPMSTPATPQRPLAASNMTPPAQATTPATPMATAQATPTPTFNEPIPTRFGTAVWNKRTRKNPDQVESMATSLVNNDPADANGSWTAPGGLAEKGTKTLLAVARQKIQEYRQLNSGKLPRLGTGPASGWSDLVSEGLIGFAPVNMWVGGANSDRVVIGNGPNMKFTTEYGWIYNPQTGDLWAAGFDVSGNALARDTNANPTGPAQATVPTTQGASPIEKP